MKKGFTLIELLVVITIIGLLASIILGNLRTARINGNNAAVKSNLNHVRSAAELFYDSNNGSYGTFVSAKCPVVPTGSSIFSNQLIVDAINAAVAAGGNDSWCISSSLYYAISVAMKSSTNLSWCIDSTGVAHQYPAVPREAQFNGRCY